MSESTCTLDCVLVSSSTLGSRPPHRANHQVNLESCIPCLYLPPDSLECSCPLFSGLELVLAFEDVGGSKDNIVQEESGRSLSGSAE